MRVRRRLYRSKPFLQDLEYPLKQVSLGGRHGSPSLMTLDLRHVPIFVDEAPPFGGYQDGLTVLAPQRVVLDLLGTVRAGFHAIRLFGGLGHVIMAQVPWG